MGTPEENVEVVRAGHAAFNDGGIEEILSFQTPDIEWHPAFGESLFGASEYRGPEGFTRYYEQVTEVFDGFRVEPAEYKTAGDYVVVDVEVTGRGRESGVALQQQMTIVWRLREGKLCWGATYFERSEALEAVGLREDDLTLTAV
jgi:ketosteroid isomerase-like protein